MRIDVHQHWIPDSYRRLLTQAGIDEAGGRPLPAWSASAACDLMDSLDVATAIVSISTPGVAFLPPVEAARTARELNEAGAALRAEHPNRFGYFATLPMPDAAASLLEAQVAIEELDADGVTMLANSNGAYLGADDPAMAGLWDYLNERRAVVFVHPADLPAPPVDGVPPFATDFLLDTTRAAFLLVRNGVRQRYPEIRFILSHAGGMVPYIAHRMAVTIMSETGRNLLDVLDDFSGFYFDTALSSSPAALPSLLAFAQPGHVLFGSDWPFAPDAAGQYFAAGLEAFAMPDAVRAGIDHDNAYRLFPRLGSAPDAPATPLISRLQRAIRSRALRTVLGAIAARQK